MTDISKQVLSCQPDLAIQLLVHLIDLKVQRSGPQSLTATERHITAIAHLIGELYNGGFDQFFSNISGGWANDVIAALDAIGDQDILPIYKKALLHFFPDGKVPVGQEERHKKMEKRYKTRNFEEISEEIDAEFYELDEQPLMEVLNERLLNLASENAADLIYDEYYYTEWLRTDIRQRCPGDREWSLHFDDHNLKIRKPDGVENILPLEDLQKISIGMHGQSRTGLFPWEGSKCPYSAYHWKFKCGVADYFVPFYANISDNSVEKLLATPGFDALSLLQQQAHILRNTKDEIVCFSCN